MTKERRLKNEALEACNNREHSMTKFMKLTNNSFISFCFNCSKEVIVILKPLPNEIEIGGEAVALDCI